MLEIYRRIYRLVTLPKTDVWGRRPATKNEIVRALRIANDEVTEADYPPTEADIANKEENKLLDRFPFICFRTRMKR